MPTNETALRRLLAAASPRPWHGETTNTTAIRIVDASGRTVAEMTGDNAALCLTFANNLAPLLDEFSALKAGR